jgi:hypothetical protein
MSNARTITIPMKDDRPDWSKVSEYGLEHPPQGWVFATPDSMGDDLLLKYSGLFLPRVGARVRVDMNRFGWGTVTGYFVEHGWLGVEVKIDQPPAWWVKQQKERNEPIDSVGHFFGIDLGAIKKAE